jgi:hypothetical protein
MVAVVGGLELDIHQIDGGGGGADEEDLHDGVVDRDVVGEQVQVARHKHDEEENLRLAGDASTRTGLPYLNENVICLSVSGQCSSNQLNHRDFLGRKPGSNLLCLPLWNSKI